MRLYIDGTEADLSPSQVVTNQYNSALTNFSLQGDKSYNYTLPNTQKNRNLLGISENYQQKTEIKNPISSMQIGGLRVIEGKMRPKKKNRQSIQVDVIVPPAGMSADFWNTSIRKLDLGSDTLPSVPVITDFWAISMDSFGVAFGGASGAKSNLRAYLQFGLHTIEVIVNNVTIFRHRLTNTYFEANFGELSAKFAEYNTSPSLAGTKLYLSDNYINIEGSAVRNVKLKVYFATRPDVFGYLEFTSFKRLEYNSVNFYLKHENLKSKKYFFPTIQAPKFYNEQGEYEGVINARNGIELKLADWRTRTMLPLVPSFYFADIFEKIILLIGYTWKAPLDERLSTLSICSFRDFSGQMPGTDFPINVYRNKLVFADYMPDWSVLEFFDQFALLAGGMWIFDTNNRTVEFVSFDKIINAKPVVIHNVDIKEESYDKITEYQLAYSDLITEEQTSEQLKSFFADTPVVENGTKLNQKLIPLAPLATPEQQAYCSALTVGASELFNLKEENPAPRVFFWSNLEAKISTTELTLSRAGDKSFYKLFWENFLKVRKGRKVTVIAYLSIVNFFKLKFETPIQFKNINHILNRKTAKFQKNKQLYEVELELEQLS
jgi:hypothetical protein